MAQLGRSGQRLSKSKLMSARQCLKRLYLEVHEPDAAVVSAATQQAFATGHAVGEVARAIYATGGATLIPHEGGLKHALRKSARLLGDAPGSAIFEATVEYGGVLVRADALLPIDDAWRIVEVKASTRIEPHYYFDCAVQRWVFRAAGYPLSRVSLAYVDNRFVYAGGGNYQGLLHEIDVSEQVAQLEPTVPNWVRDARAAIAGREPDVAVGAHCFKPYECPFVSRCWPLDATHTLFELPRANKGKLAEFVARGYRDLRDVPADRLTESQRRVQRIVESGREEVLPAAGEFVRSLGYPRYYLDFESIGPAIPVFAGMRPYRALPFQWSCHFEAVPDELQHAEFLDLSGAPPFRRLAESLIRALGKSGPILVYSPYEKTMIGRLAALFPDLKVSLDSLVERLVDLKPVVQANFYHPDMRGSWSIKAVLPQIAEDMDYSELEGIQEGTSASLACLEAMDASTDATRVAEIDAQLRRYCHFDTAALVRLTRFFAAR